MKTYTLWYRTYLTHEFGPSRQEPHTFTTLDDAQTELAIRTFNYGFQYKIVESEEQQS